MKTLFRLLPFLLCFGANAQLYRLVLNPTDFYVVQSGTSSNATITTNLITATRHVTMNTGKLLGRSTAAVGSVEDITLGTGLSFSGTTLNGSSGGTNYVFDANQFVINAATNVSIKSGAILTNLVLSGTLTVSNSSVGTSGQVLTSGGAGQPTSWTTVASSGGTVTSVSLTAPTQFSVGGTPITTSGTLALGWVNVQSNKVFAGPANNGTDAAPTFRAVDVTDLAGGNNASATTFLRGDWQWATPAGGASLDAITADAASSAIQNLAFTNQWSWTDPGASKASFTIKGTNSTASTTIDFRGQMTSATAIFHNIGETLASTGGSGAQDLLRIGTLASSTATPVSFYSRGNRVIEVGYNANQLWGANGSTTAPLYSHLNLTTGGQLYTGSAMQWQYSSGNYLSIGSSVANLTVNSVSLIAANNSGGVSDGVTLYDVTPTAVIATGGNGGAGIRYLSKVSSAASGTVTLTTGVSGNVGTGSGLIFVATGAVTYAFPSSPTVGDTYTVIVNTGSTVTLDPAGASQVLRIGAAITTANTGTATSSTQGSTVKFVYVSANLWIAVAYTGTWGTT